MRVTALQVLSDLASYKRRTHGVQLHFILKGQKHLSLDNVNVHKFLNKSKAHMHDTGRYNTSIWCWNAKLAQSCTDIAEEKETDLFSLARLIENLATNKIVQLYSYTPILLHRTHYFSSTWWAIMRPMQLWGHTSFSPQISWFPCHWSIFFSQCHSFSSCLLVSLQRWQYINSWVSVSRSPLKYPKKLQRHTTEYHAWEALDCAISYQLMFAHTSSILHCSSQDSVTISGCDEFSFCLIFAWTDFFFMRSLSLK